jgi:hypothetical protein
MVIKSINKRGALINYLIKRYQYTSYLEIGCYENATFRQINIPEKVGVDPRSGGTVRLTSDDYFNRLDPQSKFDIIFIDGLHTKEQVQKDVRNSVKHLSPDGTIVIHDCVPDAEYLQLRDTDVSVIVKCLPGFLLKKRFIPLLYALHGLFPSGIRLLSKFLQKVFSKTRKFCWTGDVWKAFVRLRSDPYLDSCCPGVDMCGVVRIRQNSDLLPPVPESDLTWNGYCANQEKWLRLKNWKAFERFLDGSTT